MSEEKKKLGEILLEAGVIDKFQLKSALAEQNKWGGRLGNHLVQMGTLTEDLLVKALSKQLKIPNLDLAQMMVTPDVLELVPHEIAEKFHLVPVAVKKIASKRTLIVAMSDPTNLDAIDELQFRTGHIIKPAVAGDTAIELAIRRYYYGEMGPQRVAGQPIEFDAGGAAQTAPQVTNVPTSDVPVPPENTFSLGEDEPAPAAPQPVAPAADDIPEASLADLGMDAPEPTQADPQFAPTTDSGAWPPAATASAPAWPAPAAAEPVWPAPAEAEPASVEPEPYDDANAAPPVEPEPYYDANAVPPVEPEPYYDANAAPPVEPEPYYDPNAVPSAEPQPYDDPNAAPPVEPDPAYADASAATAWSGEPTVADPGYVESAEPTYADAPVEAFAPAEAEEPSPGATEDPAGNGGAAEPTYPPEEPTVPADESYETAATTETWAQPAAVPPGEWAEPAPTAVEAWAEPMPSATAPEPEPMLPESMPMDAVESNELVAEAPVEPMAAEASPEAAAEDPVWPEQPAPEDVPESAAMDPAAETSVAGEPSIDSMPLEAVEPGPAEAEVDRMDAVPATWNAGDAVQTFQGTSDGHPYEPTTPGEPTHAPDEASAEPALAADGGEAVAAMDAVSEPEPYAESANGNGAAVEAEPYSVPADPLGGIPFETAEGRAIRALCALLLEKGVLTADELASRLRTAIEGTGSEGGGEGLG